MNAEAVESLVIYVELYNLLRRVKSEMEKSILNNENCYKSRLQQYQIQHYSISAA